jgi:predicted nucleic acid-binding OB-fold protein
MRKKENIRAETEVQAPVLSSIPPKKRQTEGHKRDIRKDPVAQKIIKRLIKLCEGEKEYSRSRVSETQRRNSEEG